MHSDGVYFLNVLPLCSSTFFLFFHFIFIQGLFAAALAHLCLSNHSLGAFCLCHWRSFNDDIEYRV